MKELNKYITLGLLFNGIFILGNFFDILPHFLKGIFAGLGLSCIIYGMLSEKYNMKNLKRVKVNTIRKIIKRSDDELR